MVQPSSSSNNTADIISNVPASQPVLASDQNTSSSTQQLPCEIAVLLSEFGSSQRTIPLLDYAKSKVWQSSSIPAEEKNQLIVDLTALQSRLIGKNSDECRTIYLSIETSVKNFIAIFICEISSDSNKNSNPQFGQNKILQNPLILTQSISLQNKNVLAKEEIVQSVAQQLDRNRQNLLAPSLIWKRIQHNFAELPYISVILDEYNFDHSLIFSGAIHLKIKKKVTLQRDVKVSSTGTMIIEAQQLKMRTASGLSSHKLIVISNTVKILHAQIKAEKTIVLKSTHNQIQYSQIESKNGSVLLIPQNAESSILKAEHSTVVAGNAFRTVAKDAQLILDHSSIQTKELYLCLMDLSNKHSQIIVNSHAKLQCTNQSNQHGRISVGGVLHGSGGNWNNTNGLIFSAEEMHLDLISLVNNEGVIISSASSYIAVEDSFPNVYGVVASLLGSIDVEARQKIHGGTFHGHGGVTIHCDEFRFANAFAHHTSIIQNHSGRLPYAQLFAPAGSILVVMQKPALLYGQIEASEKCEIKTLEAELYNHAEILAKNISLFASQIIENHKEIAAKQNTTFTTRLLHNFPEASIRAGGELRLPAVKQLINQRGIIKGQCNFALDLFNNTGGLLEIQKDSVIKTHEFILNEYNLFNNKDKHLFLFGSPLPCLFSGKGNLSLECSVPCSYYGDITLKGDLQIRAPTILLHGQVIVNKVEIVSTKPKPEPTDPSKFSSIINRAKIFAEEISLISSTAITNEELIQARKIKIVAPTQLRNELPSSKIIAIDKIEIVSAHLLGKGYILSENLINIHTKFFSLLGNGHINAKKELSVECSQLSFGSRHSSQLLTELHHFDGDLKIKYKPFQISLWHPIDEEYSQSHQRVNFRDALEINGRLQVSGCYSMDIMACLIVRGKAELHLKYLLQTVGSNILFLDGLDLKMPLFRNFHSNVIVISPKQSSKISVQSFNIGPTYGDGKRDYFYLTAPYRPRMYHAQFGRELKNLLSAYDSCTNRMHKQVASFALSIERTKYGCSSFFSQGDLETIVALSLR